MLSVSWEEEMKLVLMLILILITFECMGLGAAFSYSTLLYSIALHRVYLLCRLLYC